ncbi:MAG: PHP domain-containing protein [Bacteroidota bacterium]
MYDLRADLHLHSTLSPCAERSMTPRGLIRAALAADLAAVALTDHHAAGNTPAFLAAAEEAGIWAIPGMEVQTAEEVHLLCFFPDLPRLLAWEEKVLGWLPEKPNDERFFGPQEIYPPDGGPPRRFTRLLLTAVPRSLDTIYREAASLGGLCLPAHVDRAGFGLLPQLGLVPPVVPVNHPLEISAMADPDAVRRAFGLEPGTRFFPSSDAHRPTEVGRRPAMLRVAEASWEEFVLAVAGEGGRRLGME